MYLLQSANIFLNSFKNRDLCNKSKNDVLQIDNRDRVETHGFFQNCQWVFASSKKFFLQLSNLAQ